MKARKLKKILFGTSLLVSGILTSCVHTNSFTTSKPNSSKDSQKKEQKYDNEQNQMLREKYHKIYADSIRSANGYDSICNLTNELWQKSAELVFRADSLAAENSLGYVMQKEVEGAGDKILKDFIKNVSNILKPYHISLQNYILGDNAFFWNFNTHIQQEEDYDDTDYVLKQPLIYFGVNTCGVADISGHEFDELMAIINHIIQESPYASAHKNEIMNKINALIKKTKPKLIASRKAIERKYADYYVVIDGQDAAFIPYSADDWVYGYSDTEFPERQTVVKQTTTSVYSQNLSADFFSDKKAKYNLINLGNNEWRIAKTSKYGNESSEVFTAIPEVLVQEYYAGNEAHNHDEFKFKIGNNGGIQITTDDFVVLKRAKLQWWPSHEVLRQLDNLDEQSVKFSGEAAKLEKKKKQISQYADSVATQMVNQYLQTR